MSTATSGQKGSLFSALQALTEQAFTEKTAAPVPADPGTASGSSTHPSKSVDNHGQTASEGARAAENTRDNKEDQGPAGVDSTPEDVVAAQGDGQLNIGMQQSATGEDPSVEDGYKADKEDPGTTHPAATDNDELDGHKYASLSMQELYQLHTKLADHILADLATGHTLDGGTAASETATDGTTASSDTQQALEKEASLDDVYTAAGYDLAAQLGMTKEAAQQLVAGTAAEVLQDARTDAQLVGDYLATFYKTAMDGDAAAAAAEDSDHDAAEVAAGADAATESTGDVGGEVDPAVLEALLQEEAASAGPEEAAIDPTEEEALTQLVGALDELGVPVEALEQLDVPEEEEPAAEAPEAGVGMKLAAAVRTFKRSGRYKHKTAEDGTPERALRDLLKSQLLELLNRSR